MASAEQIKFLHSVRIRIVQFIRYSRWRVLLQVLIFIRSVPFRGWKILLTFILVGYHFESVFVLEWVRKILEVTKKKRRIFLQMLLLKNDWSILKLFQLYSCSNILIWVFAHWRQLLTFIKAKFEKILLIFECFLCKKDF